MSINIHATAVELLREHGELAGLIAALRADEHMARGDLDGDKLWGQVIAAIEALEGPHEPPSNERQ